MAIGKKTGGKPFPKGHKLAKGGKRPGAGRPTKQAAAEKILVAEVMHERIEKRAVELADKYVETALEDPATLRHLIERYLPPAKTEIEAAPRYNVIIETFDPNVERRRTRDKLLQEDED